jgi:glycosyltransferase involved in cell wall biosynthesis
VARRLPGLLTVSEASKTAAVTDFGLDPARVRVAFNGVDHDVFRPDPSTPRDPNLIAATASSDTALKGLVDLIRAFARLAPARPKLRLAVIGRLRDGPAQRALDSAGLGDRVTFTNGVTVEAIADLYRRAGLVIAPSRFEGFGFPAAEAMACGACVLAADGGALPEVVADAGVIVPAADPGALATAAASLLDAPGRRAAFGEAAAARAATTFSWASHARAALDLYADVGARAHRSA